MPCFKTEESVEETRIRYLLGPAKNFSQTEAKLYALSGLCDCSKKGTQANQKKRDKDEPSAAVSAKPSGASSYTPLSYSQASSSNNELGKHEDKREVTESVLDSVVSDVQLFIPKSNIPGILQQQTYRQWKSSQDLKFGISKMRKRKTIYLLPLEVFPDFINDFEFTLGKERRQGFFTLLQTFLSAFFTGFRVELKATKLIEEYGWKVKSRYHKKTQEKQLLVSDIYTNMRKVMPSDGFAMLGVTWTDLYPSDDLNFVLGEASSVNQTGVFCFGRFEPKAYVGDVPPPPITEITSQLIWRMLKLISHECCHIYGLSHCVYFECAMNESSSMAEALSQPIFLCPVCLRKLQKCARFDIVLRYKSMLHFFVEINQQYQCDYFENAIIWLRNCIYYLKENGRVTDSREDNSL